LQLQRLVLAGEKAIHHRPAVVFSVMTSADDGVRLVNYQKHYDLLIERARVREKPAGYSERHHIIPRCLGGSDELKNIVSLTAREHFLAHLLIAKAFPSELKLSQTAYMMANFGQNTINSKTYSILRSAHKVRMSKFMKEYCADPEVKRKKSKDMLGDKNPMSGKVGGLNPFYGKTHSSDTRAIISYKSKLRTGWVHSEETKRKIGLSQVGENNHMFGKTVSVETREKISNNVKGSGNPMFGKSGESAPAFGRTGTKHPMFGKKHSEETKKKIAEACRKSALNKIEGSK
jgi:hypothetical protein